MHPTLPLPTPNTTPTTTSCVHKTYHLPSEGSSGRAIRWMSQWLAQAKKQYSSGGRTSTRRTTSRSPMLLRLPSKSHSRQQPSRRVSVMTRQKWRRRWRWYLTSEEMTLCSYSRRWSSSSISFSLSTRWRREELSSFCLSCSCLSSSAMKKHWWTAQTVIPSSTASSENRTGTTPRKSSESAQQAASVRTLRIKYLVHCYRRKTRRRKVRQRMSDHTILARRPAGLMPTAIANAPTRSRARQPTEAAKRAMSRRSQLEYCVRVSSRTYSPATYPSASTSTPKRRQFWQTGKDCTSKATPASPIITLLLYKSMQADHSLGPLRLWLKTCLTFLMNSIVSRYLSLLTSDALCTINARSFVMKPRSTVSMTLRSRVCAKTVSQGVLSSLAR